MEKITSFCVNHDILPKGMYISRVDGDIITYDLRMVVPNGGIYLGYIRGKSTWDNTDPLVLVDGIERNMNDVG